jgi:hypothetical protein
MNPCPTTLIGKSPNARRRLARWVTLDLHCVRDSSQPAMWKSKHPPNDFAFLDRTQTLC